MCCAVVPVCAVLRLARSQARDAKLHILCSFDSSDACLLAPVLCTHFVIQFDCTFPHSCPPSLCIIPHSRLPSLCIIPHSRLPSLCIIPHSRLPSLCIIPHSHLTQLMHHSLLKHLFLTYSSSNVRQIIHPWLPASNSPPMPLRLGCNSSITVVGAITRYHTRPVDTLDVSVQTIIRKEMSNRRPFVLWETLLTVNPAKELSRTSAIFPCVVKCV
ncbi:hypothetical protein BZA77DRAFT_118750 [Pyronema omphalodes]|nr:hypothetical protein BZA77DRAFT_118750 [Pyronema omphalodes]